MSDHPSVKKRFATPYKQDNEPVGHDISTARTSERIRLKQQGCRCSDEDREHGTYTLQCEKQDPYNAYVTFYYGKGIKDKHTQSYADEVVIAP